MRKVRLFVVIAVIPFLAGCAVSDVLFGIFGDYYSEGGTTPTEKKWHYDQQVEHSKNYEKYGSM